MAHPTFIKAFQYSDSGEKEVSQLAIEVHTDKTFPINITSNFSGDSVCVRIAGVGFYFPTMKAAKLFAVDLSDKLKGAK